MEAAVCSALLSSMFTANSQGTPTVFHVFDQVAGVGKSYRCCNPFVDVAPPPGLGMVAAMIICNGVETH
jgi:hypothetical protein